MSKKGIREITNQADVEMFLNLKEEDITTSFIMNNFAQFNGNPPKFNVYDEIVIPAGAFTDGELCNTQSFRTSLGSWIFNKFFIERDLIGILGYHNEAMSKKNYGKLNNKLAYALLEDDIIVDVFKRFIEKGQKFMPYVSIFSPSVTKKLLLCDKEIEKEKKKLLKKYEKEVAARDGVVIEQIEKELLDFAQDYLDGDDSLECYDSGARMSFDNHFKNMYVMRGLAVDPDPNKGYNVMTSCYNSGISAEDYSALCNSLARGPYSRARKTSIGGYWEKLFVAGYQHLVIDPPGSDCGTKRYIEFVLTNPEDYLYSYIIEGNNLVELTSKNMDKYRNKKVKMRFASLCESKTGFCNKCAGNLFNRLGMRNVGVALAAIPGQLKNLAMKSFHDSTVKTVEMDINKAFGIKK